MENGGGRTFAFVGAGALQKGLVLFCLVNRCDDCGSMTCKRTVYRTLWREMVQN